MSRSRVVQWSSLARTWWLFDANNQCPFKSAKRIIAYLQGLNKPVYFGEDEVGDHVVAYNTRHIAMRADFWRTYKHHSHTRYAGGYSRISAWRVHEMDPTRVLQRSVHSNLAGLELRRNIIARLHLFPDDNVPENILNNITGHIQQIQAVPKKLQDYTQQEIDSFPRLFELPEDYDLESYRRENQQEPDQHTSQKWRLK